VLYHTSQIRTLLNQVKEELEELSPGSDKASSLAPSHQGMKLITLQSGHHRSSIKTFFKLARASMPQSRIQERVKHVRVLNEEFA